MLAENIILTRCFIIKNDLFREKEGLQPIICRHGKPWVHSGLRALVVEVYLEKGKGRKEKGKLEP